VNGEHLFLDVALLAALAVLFLHDRPALRARLAAAVTAVARRRWASIRATCAALRRAATLRPYSPRHEEHAR
jgi:hypothetical protein